MERKRWTMMYEKKDIIFDVIWIAICVSWMIYYFAARNNQVAKFFIIAWIVMAAAWIAKLVRDIRDGTEE